MPTGSASKALMAQGSSGAELKAGMLPITLGVGLLLYRVLLTD